MKPGVRRSPGEVALALQRWLTGLPEHWPPADPATAAFCRARLAHLADEQVLAAKLACDLGSQPWRPLGHVLAVISENDHLGVIGALIAAALTGNRLTLKSRTGLEVMQQLRDALGRDAASCRIADWDSSGQDDAELLQEVDGIVMAGSAALIRHYRGIAAPGVRLIEYGPQASVAWVAIWPATANEQNCCVEALIRDTTLFQHNVCSSPQCVLVPDDAGARSLFTALKAELPCLPPLPTEIGLQQSAKARELSQLTRLGEPIEVAFDAGTGWGVTISPPDPACWLPRGFRIFVGDLQMLKLLFPLIQTLGVWPYPTDGMEEAGAMHCCRLGTMHERPLSAPHDGHWELAQWVRFVSFSPID
jgi:hypothetical protein